jgi:type II secretory pathway component PulF
VATSLFEPQIGTKPLAALCRRLSLALGAGVDVRNVWLRETKNAHGGSRARFEKIRQSVAAGATISDGLAPTGNYFPEMFRELVRVGEQTGHLPEVFRQLADHYDQQLKMKRTFLSAISWPLVELGLALAVVGGLIYLMGAMPQLAKSGIDLLGFGLKGASGLAVYLLFLAAVAAVVFVIYRATVRGMLWVAPVQRAIMAIPRLGTALETMALARLAWALHVTLNTGMDVRDALRLSLATTHNVLYTQHTPRVLNAISRGHDIHAAFSSTNVFPLEFLASVQVGEESGRLVESMEHLAEQYQDQARGAMNTLTILMGLGVTGLIAAVIIFLIFRVFGTYTGAINDALKMKP